MENRYLRCERPQVSRFKEDTMTTIAAKVAPLTRVNVPNILVDGFMWSDMLTDLTREKFPHTDMIKLDDDKFEIHLSLE